MGEGKGWVSVYRKIQDSWLWQEKPFSKGQAWIDLLLSANHQNKKTLLGNELLIIKRGSLITSQKKLMQRWGWGSEKTRKFLKLLNCDGMIRVEADKKKTTIVINNYEVYQNQNGSNVDVSKNVADKQNENRIQTECNQNATRIQSETNNNDNNDNNVNNDNNIYSQNSNEFRLAAYLYKFIKRNNQKAKEPNFQKWAKQFDYILRIDKRDIEEVKKVIVWCQDDGFWFKNILSPDKLRKHYDRLILQMNEPKKSNKREIVIKKDDPFTNYTQRKYDFDDLEKKLLGWDKGDG